MRSLVKLVLIFSALTLVGCMASNTYKQSCPSWVAEYLEAGTCEVRLQLVDNLGTDHVRLAGWDAARFVFVGRATINEARGVTILDEEGTVVDPHTAVFQGTYIVVKTGERASFVLDSADSDERAAVTIEYVRAVER